MEEKETRTHLLFGGKASKIRAGVRSYLKIRVEGVNPKGKFV